MLEQPDGSDLSQSSSVKRRDAKKALSRRAIIEATINCIVAHGIAGVTISRICSESGVARGMVNAHFGSKDNLLLEVLKSIAADYQAALDSALAGKEGDPADALRVEIETETALWLRSHVEACAWFAFRAAALSNQEYLACCGSREAALFGVPMRLCRDLIDQGGYRNLDPEAVAQGLTAILEGYWFDWVTYPDSFDVDAARAGCLRYLRGCFPNHF